MKREYVVLALVVLLGIAFLGLRGLLTRKADEISGTGQAEISVADLAARKNRSGYTDITVEELAGILQQLEVTVVNVHIPFAGDVPDTDLSIPYNLITQELDKLPSKDAPIVLYCRSGSMSTQAANVLAGMGYTNIFELDGGFNAWQSAGYELLNTQ